MNQPYAAVSEITQHAPPAVRLALKALLVAVVCHLSIQVGHAFKFPPHDISALWPTSAVLVSILIASPIRHWWVYLLAGYSTYAIDVARFGFLASDVLYNLADIVKVLIAAVGVRRFAGGLRAFDNLRGLVLYIAFAVVLAPVTSAFIAALAGAGGNYWFYWRAWCMSEALAFLVLAPAILTWIATARAPPKGISLARSLEAGMLAAGLIAISLVVLHGPPAVEGSVPVLVYLPLPFLLWAAVRFGPVGVNTALMAVAFLAISGILQGRGPFATPAPADNVLPLQLFLVMLSLPLMFLAALIAERRVRTHALRESEARYRSMAVAIDEALAFERLAAELSTGFIYLAPAQIDQFIGAALRRVVGTLGIDRSTLAEFSPDLGFLRFTHSWAVNGAEPVAGVVSTDLVPWACARLEAKLPVVVDRMSDLPREASIDEVFWQRTGVRSLVVWPLHVGDELAGSLSLVCLRARTCMVRNRSGPCAEPGQHLRECGGSQARDGRRRAGASFRAVAGRYLGLAPEGAVARSGRGRWTIAAGDRRITSRREGRAVVAGRRVGSPRAGVQLACRKVGADAAVPGQSRASVDAPSGSFKATSSVSPPPRSCRRKPVSMNIRWLSAACARCCSCP